MEKRQSSKGVQLMVHAPMRTKDVMMALRDWEPVEGVKFTLAKRKSYTLVFDVSTASGYQARGFALERLRETGLAATPELDVSVV